MDDKEKLYKERISPLLKQAYDLAKELEIPLVALVQVRDDTILSTAVLIPGCRSEMVLAQIAGEEGLVGVMNRTVVGMMEESAEPMPTKLQA